MVSTRLRGIEMLERRMLLTTTGDTMSTGADRIVDVDILKPDNATIIDIDIHHTALAGIIDIDILRLDPDKMIDIDIHHPIGSDIIDIDILAPDPAGIIDIDILHPNPSGKISFTNFSPSSVFVDIHDEKSGGLLDTGVLRHDLKIALSPETIVIGVYFGKTSASKDAAAYIVVQPMPSPTEAIVGLLSDVRDLELSRGIEKSLVKQAEGALKKLEDGNPKNDAAAVGKLNGFANHVRAQAGKKIAEVDAEKLLSCARSIIHMLNEPL